MIHVHQIEKYDVSEYIVTSSGTKISRQAEISKPQFLEIPNGRVVIKSQTEIACESTGVLINKYSMIGERTKLKPSYALEQTNRCIPMTIGSHCFIGNDCIIESASIGVSCYVGDFSILSARTILKDFVYVEPYTFVPPDMVVPPFSIVKGNPAKIIGEMPESFSTIGLQNALLRYHLFKASNDPCLGSDE